MRRPEIKTTDIRDAIIGRRVRILRGPNSHRGSSTLSSYSRRSAIAFRRKPLDLLGAIVPIGDFGRRSSYLLHYVRTEHWSIYSGRRSNSPGPTFRLDDVSGECVPRVEVDNWNVPRHEHPSIVFHPAALALEQKYFLGQIAGQMRNKYAITREGEFGRLAIEYLKRLVDIEGRDLLHVIECGSCIRPQRIVNEKPGDVFVRLLSHGCLLPGSSDGKKGCDERDNRSEHRLIPVQPKLKARAACRPLQKPVLGLDNAQRISEGHPRTPCEHEGDGRQADELCPRMQAAEMHRKTLPMRRVPRKPSSLRLHSFARAA